MTGYGKASAEFQGKKITAEVKSLNSKALDLSTRIASVYREKEMEVRAMLTQSLERGKVEFCLWVEQLDHVNAGLINGELVSAYYCQMEEISQRYGIPAPADYWQTLMRMPDVLSRSETQQELSEEEWQVARDVVQNAIGQLMTFRQQEGEALQKKDLSGVMSSLSGEQAARINEILSDKEALSRLLSSSEAKNIIRALKDDGKR